ncbi:hypothetical protein [Ochrobactrum sp. BTU1]|uniref:hypothetical protein n=1 Tax=Ochrobactrum sp. BTU1 TaxID=2840456 RepID=UPI001C04B5A8|nr:hypothetical protein KMS41_24885 [Ochrobactrum sp. BTU1]
MNEIAAARPFEARKYMHKQTGIKMPHSTSIKATKNIRIVKFGIYPLLLSTMALVSTAIPGFAACVSSGPGSYLCSGVETTGQTVGGLSTDTIVSFAPGSSIASTDNLGLQVRGANITYSDLSDTEIGSGYAGLNFNSGDTANITINGVVSAEQALEVSSSSGGRITIVNRGTIEGHTI